MISTNYRPKMQCITSILSVFVLALLLFSCGTQKNKMMKIQNNLHDIWAVQVVEEKSVLKSGLNMYIELHVENMSMMGNDGCNNIGANIKEVSENKIAFQDIYGTKKLCPDMNLPNSFRKALDEVRFYNRDGLTLNLENESKKVIIKLKKVD